MSSLAVLGAPQERIGVSTRRGFRNGSVASPEMTRYCSEPRGCTWGRIMPQGLRARMLTELPCLGKVARKGKLPLLPGRRRIGGRLTPVCNSSKECWTLNTSASQLRMLRSGWQQGCVPAYLACQLEGHCPVTCSAVQVHLIKDQ